MNEPTSIPKPEDSTVPPTAGHWWIFDNNSGKGLRIVARRTSPFREIAYLEREPDQDFAEVEANAQLIVASRDLFAELRWAVEWMEHYEGECMPEWREWALRGRKALNIVTGGAS